MDVTIESFVGTHARTKKPVHFDQYRIRVDGLHAGYIGFKAGSAACMTSKFSPIELAEIESQVAVLVNAKVEAAAPPDVPEELRKKLNQEDGEFDVDDFDA